MYMIPVCVYQKGWRLFRKPKRDGRNGKISRAINQRIA